MLNAKTIQAPEPGKWYRTAESLPPLSIYGLELERPDGTFIRSDRWWNHQYVAWRVPPKVA
jgi:hypothetical protein